MRKGSSLKPFAVFLLIAAAVAATTYCIRTAETPPWSVSRSGAPNGTAATDSGGNKQVTTDFEAFTFLTYNVKNWLVSSQSPTKSAESKDAIISILASGAPDIIGLCEIGSRDDVREIQAMLLARGMDFPHFHYAGGVDPIRHLALLSRFPIISTENPDPRIAGTEHSMQRGILDATLRIGGSDVRFLGLHLKSKRYVPEFDEAVLRIAEAGHVRKHIDAIFGKNPDALLLTYGDLNDTTRSLSTRMIYGTYRTPGYMNPIHVKDSRNETWTYHYAAEDSYTRIDFVTVSRALKRYVEREESRIIDDPHWETASDHRPVLVHFE